MLDGFLADGTVSDPERNVLEPWFQQNNGSTQNAWFLEKLINLARENYVKNNQIETFALCPLDGDTTKPTILGQSTIEDSASLIKLFALALVTDLVENLDETLIQNTQIPNQQTGSSEIEEFKTVGQCVEAIGNHSSNIAFNKLVYHLGAKALNETNPSPQRAKAQFNELLKEKGFTNTQIDNFLCQEIEGDGKTNPTCVPDLLKAMQIVAQNTKINQYIYQENIDDSCRLKYNNIDSLFSKIGSNDNVFGNIAVIEKEGQKYISLIIDKNYLNESDSSGKRKVDNIENNNSNNCFLAEATETLI